MVEEYPFVFVYIYIQYIFLYLTFRVKHCSSMSHNATYRFHLFNFIFAIFNAIIGYIELVQAINGDGMLSTSVTYFILECSSLVCAHVIFGIYVCCP
mmetsp:Transcript_2515/g.2453  ORF Transcript_2515/g.2453 Transcript_2515/m.2453 type:complete len:97 (+) Transcript_2515:118-408(+)